MTTTYRTLCNIFFSIIKVIIETLGALLHQLKVHEKSNTQDSAKQGI